MTAMGTRFGTRLVGDPVRSTLFWLKRHQLTHPSQEVSRGREGWLEAN